MKSILVTGGAGFIGSHLCKALSENENNHVICLDNLFTGSLKNIQQLKVEFIRHDVIEPILLEVDEIYHLACPASPVHYQYNRIKTVKTNVLGTINMLGLAKRTNAKLFLASTSEIYGNPLVHPQTEDYFGNVNTIGPRSCYDEGKRIAETLCMDYHNEHNVRISIARIFNTYGPKMAKNDGRVVSNFIVQALNNEDITIYGDGSQTRSFCYVSDLVNGIMTIMKSDQTGPFNLGNPTELTILSIAQLIQELTNTKSKIIFKELPQDDPIKRKPDITKIQQFGWNPQIDLNTGLNRTIEYFQN